VVEVDIRFTASHHHVRRWLTLAQRHSRAAFHPFSPGKKQNIVNNSYMRIIIKPAINSKTKLIVSTLIANFLLSWNILPLAIPPFRIYSFRENTGR
jgi:hypothetical protein